MPEVADVTPPEGNPIFWRDIRPIIIISSIHESYISKQGGIRLPFKSTKEQKPKTIPINHHLQTILDNQPKAIHHDFVFNYRGNPIAEGGIKRSFKTACINSNVPYGRKTDNGITFHDLRRTVKTGMLKAGVNKVYRDLILGHSLRGMDAYYIKPDDDDLKQAMDVYTEWFDEQLKAAKQNDIPIQHPRKKLFP